MTSQQCRYQHARYPAGTSVSILYAILDCHRESPIAGKNGIAVESFYDKPDVESPMVALYIAQQKERVPVLIEETVYFVEPEFVRRT